jgi:hypothetical protein
LAPGQLPQVVGLPIRAIIEVPREEEETTLVGLPLKIIRIIIVSNYKIDLYIGCIIQHKNK